MFRFSMPLQALRRLVIAGGLTLCAALASVAQAAVPPGNGAPTYDIMLHSSCCYSGDPIAANQSLWHAFFETPATPAVAPGVTLTETTDLTQLNNFDMLYIAQSNIDALSAGDMTIIANWVNAGGTLVINNHDGGGMGDAIPLFASTFGAFLGTSYMFTSDPAPSGDNMVVTNAANRLVTTPNILDATDLSNWGSSVHGAFSFTGSAYQCAVNSVGQGSLPVLCYALYGAGGIILTGFDPECGAGCHDDHLTGGTKSGSEMWENFVCFANGCVTAAEPGPEANLIVNGNAYGEEVVVGNPVNLEFFLRQCGAGQELFLVMKAPAMGIPVFSYLNAAGQWIPLPGDLSMIMPFMLAPPDGRYPLFMGTVPKGMYDVYFGCDFVKNGHLDYLLGAVNGVFDHVMVTVQ